MMHERVRRLARRGVTLVDVLVVSAFAATISGLVLLTGVCKPPPSRVQTAAWGAAMIEQAAELWIHLDGTPGACPSLSDLVHTRKMDRSRTEDPWGSPYQITCAADGVHVTSSGRDRLFNTPDDIHDRMKPAELEAIERR